ncbi:conserved hypothetical protein [Deferribacter desulfuricans SSM1]|uniref:Organic solvent tolerance-like N-terminal domain-containing protein n=1 Tax=Deferribacter desulfuricans (strain DSM 14783 / JCM 11476 / NBRC 101012 / SSM1) TaxID=639282 RepID=D3PD39_DEFDS|nr:lipopolysaccharide transport periplasmic protein LptA [Deferribacter desulfuricans]BAI80512.1 conserved hypothetical protein [Deferribacter desulfuricans SSM1]
MRVLFKIFIVFFVFINILFAENNVQITSKELSYDVNKKLSIFKGDVNAFYDNTTIKSDLMYVYLDNDNKPVKIVCNGNVQIVKDNMTSISNNAIFDLKKDVLTLEGNVKIWQDKNYLEGDKVVYFNKEKRVEVKNKNNQKVKIIFSPEKNK